MNLIRLLKTILTNSNTFLYSVFQGQKYEYPPRRIAQEDNDIMSSAPGTKRNAFGSNDSLRTRKRQK